MDAILLIADNNVRRRSELRHFFSSSGILVATAADGLECLATLLALEPDVLVIALEIPWGGGDGVIALVNEGLPIGRNPFVLVIGDAPAETLSARAGVRRAIASRSLFGKKICWAHWHGTRYYAAARCIKQARAGGRTCETNIAGGG